MMEARIIRNALRPLIGSAVLIAIATTIPGPDVWPQERKPQLQLSESTFDMGVVPLGKVGRYKLRVSNSGTAPLLISKITPG